MRSDEERIQSQKANGGAFWVAQEDGEKAVQFAHTSLSAADARRLLELDRYAAQTREDVYRSFEVLDAQRRELELARVYSQSRFQEFPKSHDLATDQAQRFSVARVTELQSAPSLDRPLTVTAVRGGQEPQIQVRMASYDSLPAYIQSNHEWHFDSLREILNHRLNLLQNEALPREVGLHRQADRDFVQER